MGDGWETARQPKRPPVYTRGADGLMVLPGCDWSVLQLGVPGTVLYLDVDTNHYKGNYPESCLVEACDMSRYGGRSRDGSAAAPLSKEALKALLCKEENDPSVEWFTLLPRTRLSSSAVHSFDISGAAGGGGASADAGSSGGGSGSGSGRNVTHVKITIYPDGGVQRLRVYGRPASSHSRL